MLSPVITIAVFQEIIIIFQLSIWDISSFQALFTFIYCVLLVTSVVPWPHSTYSHPHATSKMQIPSGNRTPSNWYQGHV